MISKGTTIIYSDWTEAYLSYLDGIMVWYRRDTFGSEWPSMSYTMWGF